MAIITLTTDFGLEDPYVGLMKGVILQIAPAVRIVDITHQIPPQDIVRGAICVQAALEYFPPDTIHVAVIDPGVGGGRAGIAVQTRQGLLVGPDNGLFAPAIARHGKEAAVELTDPLYHRASISATFHGRDIFAPVAAHLARGTPLAILGTPRDELAALDVPTPTRATPRVDGQADVLTIHVLYVDHFGDLVTDLHADLLAQFAGDFPREELQLELPGGRRLPGIRRTFGDVPVGELVAYIGSFGYLEIAQRNGSAAATTGCLPGQSLSLLRGC